MANKNIIASSNSAQKELVSDTTAEVSQLQQSIRSLEEALEDKNDELIYANREKD